MKTTIMSLLTNNVNSDQIFSDNENEINENINKKEKYNDNNNTNFNLEGNLNKNEIINFLDFNNKYFNLKVFIILKDNLYKSKI